MKSLLLTFLALSPMMLPQVAMAGDIEDLDGDSGKKPKKKRGKNVRKGIESEVVREINRGFYVKTGLGYNQYILTYGANAVTGQPVLDGGSSLSMGIGQDFIDNEKSSMAWEFYFQQGVHNGMSFKDQGTIASQDGNYCPTSTQCSYIQGDTRLYNIMVAVEYSSYLGRRFGVGARVGAGVMFSPLLMSEQQYLDEVVNGAWGGIRPTVHDSPHPVFVGGPTFEYYTKLSHFSIGADIEVSYAVGFDLGVGGSGYLKYTF